MPTIPATFPPRQGTDQRVHYIRKTVNFNDANIAGAYQFASLPLNAYIVQTECHVTTAFNAGSTNVLTLGVTQASANELMQSGDITAGSTGVNTATRGKGLLQTTTATNATSSFGVVSAEGGVALFAKYTQTGTPATTGQAVFIVGYIPNNDG